MKHPPKIDKFQYIRDYYGVPAYKGVKVNVYGKQGVITDADGAYICVRLDGAKHAGNYHPTDGVTYLIESGSASREDICDGCGRTEAEHDANAAHSYLWKRAQ